MYTHIHTHQDDSYFQSLTRFSADKAVGEGEPTADTEMGVKIGANCLAVSPTSRHPHTLCPNNSILGLWGEMCVLMGSRRCTQHCQKKTEPGDHLHAHQQANGFVNFHARE